MARDGANVVIAAKTADPHPKLPGTIYTAAKESMDKQPFLEPLTKGGASQCAFHVAYTGVESETLPAYWR